MDFPLPKRRTTWCDSLWWRSFVQALVAVAMMTAIAYPLITWGSVQLIRLVRLQIDSLPVASELAKGALLMLPYLWAYFFALENLARKDRNTATSSPFGQ